MLTKMGWSEGSGLGLNLSGNVSHIKVNKRGSNAGVGLKKSHEDDWISHQDDFNALLNSLNGNPTSETASPVEKMRASKHRYTKFVKSKDLSNASTDDLACIFGQRGKTGNEVAEEEEDSEGSETEVAPVGEELSLKTVESTLSMNEYFAKKMAALKQKNVAANSPICMSNIVDQDAAEKLSGTEGDVEFVKKKKKKKKEELENTVTEVEVLVETCEPIKKKKTKKKVSNDDDENRAPSPCSELSNEGNELDRSDCEVLKKKKKKKKTEDSVDGSPSRSPSETTIEDGNTVDPAEPIKKKKKKKKSKENIDEGSPVPSPCPAVEINELNDVDVAVAKKKKKSKKRKDCDDENSVPCLISGEEIVDIVLENGLVKKKKRKHTELVESCEEQTGEGVMKKKKKKKNKEM